MNSGLFYRHLPAFVIALVSVAFTYYVINWSEQRGKLAFPPDYDDSHSLIEGALRLSTLQKGGVGQLWQEFREIRPHSYGHYYYTALLFALFGIRDSVPYWANGILLFGVLWSFYRVLPHSCLLPARWAWLGGFLGLPICFHVIFDYRSECTMAALLFIGVANWLLWLNNWKSDRKNLYLAVGCFAGALAVKPVMFPYSLGVLGLCSLVYIFVQAPIIPKNLFSRAFFLMMIWLIVLLPTIPHFLFHFQSVFSYITGVAFESDFYRLKEEHGPRWLFHWIGYSGVWHLGGFSLIFGVLLMVILFLFTIPQVRPYLPGKLWLQLAFVTLGSFFGIAINTVHQPFFGMTFQLLLASTVLSGLAHLFSQEKLFWVPPVFSLLLGLYLWPVTFKFSFVLFLCGTALFLLIWSYFTSPDWRSWPGILCAGAFALLCWKNTQIAPYHNYKERTLKDFGYSAVQWRLRGPHLTWLSLKQVLQQSSSTIPVSQIKIAFPFYGWVDSNTVGWEAVLDGYPIRMLNEASGFINPSTGKISEDIDIIVLPMPCVPGIFETPTTPNHELLLQYLDNNNEWDLVSSVEQYDNIMRIYRRRDLKN